MSTFHEMLTGEASPMFAERPSMEIPEMVCFYLDNYTFISMSKHAERNLRPIKRKQQ